MCAGRDAWQPWVMADETEQPTEREAALLRLKKRRDLQGHAVVFVIVNGAIWTIWAFTGAGYPWPAWLTGLWAIGLLLNAWDTYVRRPITETDVQREITRLHPQR